MMPSLENWDGVLKGLYGLPTLPIHPSVFKLKQTKTRDTLKIYITAQWQYIDIYLQILYNTIHRLYV